MVGNPQYYFSSFIIGLTDKGVISVIPLTRFLLVRDMQACVFPHP